MADFVEIEKEGRFNVPEDFDLGQRVRIYLAWGTDNGIAIREGVVKNRENKKGIFSELALQLQVEKSGYILRSDSIEVAVLNSNRYWVQGKRVLKNLVQPYTKSYFYYCIHRAERER